MLIFAQVAMEVLLTVQAVSMDLFTTTLPAINLVHQDHIPNLTFVLLALKLIAQCAIKQPALHAFRVLLSSMGLVYQFALQIIIHMAGIA